MSYSIIPYKEPKFGKTTRKIMLDYIKLKTQNTNYDLNIAEKAVSLMEDNCSYEEASIVEEIITKESIKYEKKKKRKNLLKRGLVSTGITSLMLTSILAYHSCDSSSEQKRSENYKIDKTKYAENIKR